MSPTQFEELTKNITSLPEKTVFTTSKSMIEGYISIKYFKRIQIIQWSFGILLNLQLLLLHIYFELDLIDNPYAKVFNHLSLVVGAILVANLVFKYMCYNEYENVTNSANQSASAFALKFALLFILPYPFLEEVYLTLDYSGSITYAETEYTFKLNYLLIILAIFKSCFFTASLFIKSRYMSPRAERICNMYGARSGVIFCLRSIFKDSPFSFITTTFIISVFLFSFLFRIAEYQIYPVSPLAMYADMAWMTVITMTSVGYGDYTPKTPIGRLIGALCVSWGVLIVSVMVVVLTNAFSMNRNESQSLNILKKLEKNSELREVAAQYLRECVWRLWTNKKSNRNSKTKMRERKLMLAFRQCRRLRDMALISESDIDFFNEMLRQFQRAFINLENLTLNNMKIINYLSEEYIFREGLTNESSLLLSKK